MAEALKIARLSRRFHGATVGIVHATVHAREGWWDKKSVVDVISSEMKMKHGGQTDSCFSFNTTQ